MNISILTKRARQILEFYLEEKRKKQNHFVYQAETKS